uniref:Uncharacterized protein n=1 Tax=Timema bartmani TaxID=61472 RepID=A0A7R9ESB9_9NEOP|nr:unnamed protein product [Timema bartmani]
MAQASGKIPAIILSSQLCYDLFGGCMLPILCDPQSPLYLSDYQEAEAIRQQLASQQQALIENLAASSQFMSQIPPSPQQRHSLLQHQNSNPSGLYSSLGYPNTAEQQFQSQLLQRLQALSGYAQPLRQQPYTMLPSGGMYQTLYQQPPVSASQIGYRVSQASSYAGSPVLSHRQQHVPESPSNMADSSEEQPVQFIRPLSQVGTLTTTDGDGRMRVIVPIPANEEQDSSSLTGTNKKQKQNSSSVSPASTVKRQQDQLTSAFSNLKVSGNDERRNGPPFITRSTSEKVPNRSELMSQLTSSDKVTRWFELLQAPLSRPESGFVDCPNEELDVSEGTESLLNRLRIRKRRKILGLRLGRVSTF